MASSTIRNQGLLLSSFDKRLELVDLPIPEAGIGTAVVEVLAAIVAPNDARIYSGGAGFQLPLPQTPGFGCIGRIHDIGPDAVRLKKTSLVFVDPVVSARDDEDGVMLLGHYEGLRPEGRELMDKVWRNGTLQKFVAVPIENCVSLDENRLCNELSLSAADLMSILAYAVAAGPLLESAKLQPGETIIIGPAGGMYSGSAVEVALALGANVVALGRSEEKLSKLRAGLKQPKRLITVVMTGKNEVDLAALRRAVPNGAAVHSNWSPTGSAEALYLGVVASVLKQNARVILSGNANTAHGLHQGLMVLKNIWVAGKFMYSRKTVHRVVDLVTSGLLDIGEQSGAVVRRYELGNIEEALAAADQHGSWKDYTVITPNRV
jgi:D-arabinose 1-dehydrogenase-like Zn-dependent alcohol dehydrogenase